MVWWLTFCWQTILWSGLWKCWLFLANHTMDWPMKMLTFFGKPYYGLVYENAHYFGKPYYGMGKPYCGLVCENHHFFGKPYNGLKAHFFWQTILWSGLWKCWLFLANHTMDWPMKMLTFFGKPYYGSAALTMTFLANHTMVWHMTCPTSPNGLSRHVFSCKPKSCMNSEQSRLFGVISVVNCKPKSCMNSEQSLFLCIWTIAFITNFFFPDGLDDLTVQTKGESPSGVISGVIQV